jgi:hypothetical protein
MTGTKLSPTLPNLPSNDKITQFDGIRNIYLQYERATNGECSRHAHLKPFLFYISSPPKSFLQEETDPFHKFPRVEPHECVEVTVR